MQVRVAAALIALISFVSPAGAKTLVYCSEGSPEALNPALVSTSTAMNASRPVFNNLVEFAPGTTQLMPGLAESWTISDDGLVYTFKLRRGVKFHTTNTFTPTRELDASDIAFSILRQWKPEHPYHRVSGATYDFFADMGMRELLKAIDTPDQHTVRILLSRPEAPLLANLAMPFAAIHSAEYADQMLRAGTPERFDQEPIGTGPFSFFGYHRDVSLRYRAFADHWAGAPAVDTLVFSITTNPVVRLTKLKAGECQVMAFPSPMDTGEIAASRSLQLMQQEGLNVGYLALNAMRPPFDDVRVRRAINMAIDKNAIVTAAYKSAGVVAKNPVPPTMWSYNEAVKDYAYDPAEAQRLLAEAGHTNGFDTDLWYMPVSRPYNPNAKRVAEIIQADLARVGIRARLVTDEWSRYRSRLQAGEHTMALYGWTGDNGDPDNFLHLLLGCAAARPGGNNIAKWCNPAYDELVTNAKLTAVRSEREKLYARAQEIFKQEAPWVPLAHSVVFMAVRKGVSGFRMDPLGRQLFQNVDVQE